MTFTFDINEMSNLVSEGGKIFLSHKAEASIAKFLELEKEMAKFKDQLKEKIAEEGLKLDPVFKGIPGEHVRIGYRAFGAEYRIDEANIDKLPAELYEQKTTYSVKTKELKNYIKDHKGLPIGILKNDRKEQITMVLKGGSEDEE